MIVLQKAMEQSHLFKEDEFGVKNYNYGILGFLSLLLFSFLNIVLGYITFLAESSVVGAPVQNYTDALWLMLMSSTTIGFGDFYPVTFIGRAAVFLMFILGVGILGGVGAVFANKIFGFADTNVKNRELRKQNKEIFAQNVEMHQKLEKIEETLALLSKKGLS
jgi:hypothetical protein